MPKKPPEVVNIDDLDKEGLDELERETLEQIATIRKRWSGLVQLPEKERSTSPGRGLSQLSDPLRKLFSLLIPKDGEAPSPLMPVFQALAEEDRGEDDERFEADLLLRRMDRVDAEWRISEQLNALGRLFADDALNTGEMVVGPGRKALDLAKSVARANAMHRSALAPVLDTLRSMTKAARLRAAEALARAKGEEPKGGQGGP